MKLEQNNKLKENINHLKLITKDLANEINLDNNGPIISLLEIIFENINSLVFIIDRNDVVRYANKVAWNYMNERYNIDIVGEKWYSFYTKRKPKHSIMHDKAIRERIVVCEKYDSPHSENKFHVTAIPLIYNGVSGTICLLNIDND